LCLQISLFALIPKAVVTSLHYNFTVLFGFFVGTTWTQNIVFSLVNRGRLPLKHISEFSPFFEVDKHWDISQGTVKIKFTDNFSLLGRRIFNTHLRWDMMPKGGGSNSAKYIYVVRNPRDVVTSFYHHLANEKNGYSGTFDEFVR
jgi:hypothetical protein